MAEKIKICSFNLRIRNERDGINHFDLRVPRIIKVIEDEKPDLIGFQEATGEMLSKLGPALKYYTLLYCGRNAHCLGESAAVAVLNSTFAVIAYENFWQSFTPTVPGSRYENTDQSSCPRITTSALVCHRETGKYLRFCNTHLDHKGEDARMLGIAQICQHLSASAVPFVLTGDFNALPDSPVVAAISAFEHLGRPTIEATSNIKGTFHDFGKKDVPSKIDYVFTDAPCDPSEAYAIEKGPSRGVHISDHYPVIAFIEL